MTVWDAIIAITEPYDRKIYKNSAVVRLIHGVMIYVYQSGQPEVLIVNGIDKSVTVNIAEPDSLILIEETISRMTKTLKDSDAKHTPR